MNQMKDSTAAELLKAYGQNPQLIPNLPATVKQFIVDKGFDETIVISLSKTGKFATSLAQFVTRDADSDYKHNALYSYCGGILRNAGRSGNKAYCGAVEQCVQIDKALYTTRALLATNRFFGQGATDRANFGSTGSYIAGETTFKTPIAIIGIGAAGIMIGSILRRLGFTNVSRYERTADIAGIWSHENVYKGTKNNPRALSFLDYNIEAAPGAGADVRKFLLNVKAVTDVKDTHNNVTAVVHDGEFKHRIILDSGKSEATYPIVINCIGLGKPRPVSDPRRMKTDVTTTLAGERWQRQLSLAEVTGKMFVFIGLGNSTAEMIHQLHTFQDQGVDCDYRIITHYPEESVLNPEDKVDGFRVFRDLSAPNLVDFQGDLPASRYDYYRALRTKRIIAGIENWNITKNRFYAGYSSNFQFDKLFTLIGYGHAEEEYIKLGITYDHENRCGMFDYDGEAITQRGGKTDKRIIKGYYGFGAILASPHDMNAIVIPGMLYRMHDLLFGVLMRSAEYALKTYGSLQGIA